MKFKLLLLAICCSLLIVACKKEGGPAPTPPDANEIIKEKVLGNWELVDLQTTYYEKTGSAANTQTTTPEPNETKQTWNFAAGNLAKSNDSRGERVYQFDITPVSGKQQLTLDRNNSIDVYNLTIEGSTMTWAQEQTLDDPTYSKVVVGYHFKKL